jgi:hypothetical protein
MAGLGPFKHPQDKKQDRSSDRRRDDRCNQATSDTDAENAGQPSADERADNTDNNITEQTKAAALKQRAREPSRDSAYDQPDDDSVSIHAIPQSNDLPQFQAVAAAAERKLQEAGQNTKCLLLLDSKAAWLRTPLCQ